MSVEELGSGTYLAILIIIGVTPLVHSGLPYPETRARDPLAGRVVP